MSLLGGYQYWATLGLINDAQWQWDVLKILHNIRADFPDQLNLRSAPNCEHLRRAISRRIRDIPEKIPCLHWDDAVGALYELFKLCRSDWSTTGSTKSQDVSGGSHEDGGDYGSDSLFVGDDLGDLHLLLHRQNGRRPLLIYGAIAMGICHFVVAGILSSGEYVPGGIGGNPNVLIRVTGSASHTVIAFSYLLIIISVLTLAPVCWVYAAEVWSLEPRATGMGIAAIGNWLFNFALGLYIPPGFQNITWKMFLVFGVMCILAAVQFFSTYPETCGKTLEEIEELFAPGGPKPWHTTPGNSKLDAMVDDARAHQKHIDLDTSEVKAETAHGESDLVPRSS